MRALDLRELRTAMEGELDRRRGNRPFRFRRWRDGPETLYGLTGAINGMASLGIPLGDCCDRELAAREILAHRLPDGTFNDGSGPGHALHMILAALHLLGQPIPGQLHPLAPADPSSLPGWLDRHDWTSTHKELCGQTIPLLASGLVGDDWIDTLVQGIASRLSPARPLDTWCAPDTPPWRVISCVFHVLSIFDTGRIPYPHPDLLLQRLLDLRWEVAPPEEKRTFCTDGDWALVLQQLVRQRPACAEQAMEAIRKVSARRVLAWEANPSAVLDAETHDLYCYLWSTAVFQACARDHYRGGFLRDTFNDPTLFRLA